MKWPNLGPLPYFLGGIAVGVFVDRAIGGPGGNAGFAAVVSIVAAAVALSGPLLQERMRQGSEERSILREERKEHATDIAETTLQWLGAVWFNPDTSRWSPSRVSPLTGLSYTGGNTGNNQVELLQFWRYALEHIAADPDVGPAWAELARHLGERAQLKAELDGLTARKLREAIERTFGSGFVPSMSWTPPRSPRCYDQSTTLGRLRGLVDVGSLKLQETNYSAGPETSAETRFSIFCGPEELIATSEPGLLDVERYRRMYSDLRKDNEFRTRLAKIQELDDALRLETTAFGPVAWAYFERVRGTKHIPGMCGLCPKLDG